MRALVFCILAAVASLTSADVKDCGAGTSKFQITKLAMDPPNNVVAGQNVSLTLLYENPYEVVSAGTATTSLTFNGIPFAPSNEDLCTKIVCPLDTGSHDGSSWYEFPAGLSGKIVSTVRWKDTAGTELLCIEATLRASVADETKAAGRWWFW